MKQSQRGIQFFAHKAIGSCSTAPESEAHLRIKQIIVETARKSDWEAQTEVAGTTPSGEPWRADVLAVKGKYRVAVEVQWSDQTNEEILRRQARYTQSRIRGLWLLRQRGFPITHDLPAAYINGNPECGFVAVLPSRLGSQSISMEDFLNAAFSRRLLFRIPLGVSATVSILIGLLYCWSCGCETKIITNVYVNLGPDRYEFSVFEFDKYLDLFETIRQQLPRDLGIGAIKRRFSRTAEQAYLSNGCFHCDKLIGAHFELTDPEEWETACVFPIRISERWRTAIEGHHDYEVCWRVYSTADLARIRRLAPEVVPVSVR